LGLALAVAGIASACGSQSRSAFGTYDAGTTGSNGTSSGGTAGDDSSLPPGDDSGIGFGHPDATMVSSEGGVIASALVFKPAQTTLILDGVNPQMTTFQLWATVNGASYPVIPTSLQFDRPDLGTITTGSTITLTAFGTHGGVGHLQGIYGGLSAGAEVDMIVEQKNLGTVPQMVANAIDSASGGSAADGGPPPPPPAPSDTAVTSLLYPYDKTVFPLGLTSPLIMWNAPNANDTYRLRLQEKGFTYDLYTTVTLPAQIRVPQAVWDTLTGSNAGPGDPLQVILSRYDAGTQMAAVSVVNSWTIAPAALQGAIYYWTATNVGGRIGYITRLPAGNGAMPQKLNSGRCMGCHAVSADGTTLAASIDDYASAPAVAPYVLAWMGTRPTRPWASFDVTQATTPVIYQSNEYGADNALTPDGKYLIWGAPTPVAGSKTFSLSAAKAGAASPPGTLIVNSGLDALQATLGTDTLQMPAFSPDGTMLAVVRNDPTMATVAVPNGDNVLPYGPKSIDYLTFNEATTSFGATITPIVQATDPALIQKGLAYPSFTPDNKYIAFHSGTHSTGCQNIAPALGGGFCDDTTVDDGDLYLAPVGGGGAVRLATTDDPPNMADHHASVEPTFDPAAAGGYSWVVFTSMRVWGNQPWPAGVSTTTMVNGRRRLWVAAIDQTIGKTDPSHPAFYLEGQDNAPNMRGFWANGPCIATPMPGSDAGASASCTQDYQCCSGFCQNAQCVTPSTISCKSVTSACKTAGDCCNAASNAVMCISGVCTVATAN
jgi:hypothetical protein